MTQAAHVLVTSRTFSSAAVDQRAALEEAGARVTIGHSDHDLVGTASTLRTVTHWIAGTAPVTREHLDLAPKLELVARYGTGYDNVDLDAARSRSVWVTHTPGANAAAVADFALALCLDGWTTTSAPRRDLSTLSVGLWGLGCIGSRLAIRLRALGCELMAHDPHLPSAAFDAAGARRVSVDELGGCDVVSLHRPGGEQVVDDEWLGRVKRGLVLVNTSRSSLVDAHDLKSALLDGRVAAYRSDVDELDDKSPLADPAVSHLVRVTPHRASHSQHAIDTTSARVVAQVVAVLRGEAPDDALVSAERTT